MSACNKSFGVRDMNLQEMNKRAQFAKFVEELKQKGIKGEQYRQKIMQWHREHEDEPKKTGTQIENEKAREIEWDKRVKIRKLLIAFSKVAQQSYLKKMPKTFTKNDGNKFLIATILDQGVSFEEAWESPEILEKRLGHLDPDSISQMPATDLARVIRSPKSLHRFPNKMAKYLKDSCRLLSTKYKSDFRNVWSDLDSSQTSQIIERLIAFSGIGQKKSTMATRILWELGPLSNFETRHIDISLDRHVVRVFLRTGLVNKEDSSVILYTARRLLPSFPALLDPPSWKIGKDFCHRSNPNCYLCPLSEPCPKFVNRIETISY